VSPAWIEQFHHLSNRIPRVQAYAMAAAHGDPEKALDALRPGGKGLREVLRSQFDQAWGKVGQEALFDRVVGGLAALSPPIPIEVLVDITGTTADTLTDIVYDLFPGVRIDGDQIFIADEDFEDFIHKEAQSTIETTRAKIADYFQQTHLTNAYAATHIADALLTAGRGTELLPLIQRDPRMKVIVDPIVRREVYLRRLRLALSACRSAGNGADVTKVVLISAEADKDETALRQVLESEIDLAVEFAGASLKRLVLTDRDNVHKQGSVLAQDAARAARVGDLITARERLASHKAWLKRRRSLNDEEMQSWTVSDDDIAGRAEAIFEIRGLEAVLHELRRWRPRSVPIRAALRLVPALIESGKTESLIKILRKELVVPPWNLLIIVPLAFAGETIEKSWLRTALRRLRKSFVPELTGWHHPGSDDQWDVQWYELLLTACELAANLGVGRSIIDKVLRLLDPSAPTSATQATELDAKIRIWLLRRHLGRHPSSVDALLKALAPSRRNKKHAKRDGRSKIPLPDDRTKELGSVVRALFPVYLGRIVIIKEKQSAERVLSLTESIPNILDVHYNFDYNYWSKFLRGRAATSIMRLMALPNSSPATLLGKASAIMHDRYKDAFGSDLSGLLEHLTLRPSEHSLVQQLATVKTSEIKNLAAASSDKVRAFVRFSRVVLRVSRPDAELLFSTAIELAKEIDWEAMHQIEVLCALTVSGADSVLNRQGTAIDVFRFISWAAECLSDQERFPWSDAVTALARLAMPVALASIARWADDGTISFERTLPPLLQRGAGGTLGPEAVTGLAILLEAPDSIVVEAILQAIRGTESERNVHEELARDCLLHARPWDRLDLGRLILSHAGSAATHASHDLSRLQEAVAFLEELRPSGGDSSNGADAGPRPIHRNETRADVDISGRRFTTPEEIRAVLDLGAALGPFRDRELLLRMREATALRDCLPFLDALAEVELDSSWETDRVDAIVDALESWTGLAIEQWRRHQLPRLIVKRFSALARWLKQGDSSLQRLLSAARIEASERLQVLAEGVETSGLGLGSRALFGVLELMVADLPQGEAGQVLDWYARRLVDRVPPETARVMPLDDVPLAATVAVGRFTFALLGDIDTRIRWRAAHALRRFARLGATEFLDAVIANWGRTEERAFRDPDAPFYWLAARLWLAMALDRISAETPDAVSRHLSFLARVATDTDLPHVVIREHAKRATLHLTEGAYSTLPLPDLDQVRCANEPRMRPIRPKTPGRWGNDWRKTSGTRFSFDSTDILPYWYSHVLDIFPRAGMALVLDRAEHWILDRWGAPENANWWDTEPRKARYDERRFGLLSHGHGTLPMVERYGTYLEWHAMCCTVGELLETHAPRASDNYFENFDYWLSRYLPTDTGVWLSDRREPTPFETGLWVLDPRSDVSWLRSARQAEFIHEIVGRGEHAGWVAVAASYSVQFATRRSQVRVESALVSPNTAPALGRALQTVTNPFNFRIPPEDHDLQIDQPPYRLIGWLPDDERDMCFDERDPMRHQVRRLERRPGRAATTSLRLKLRPDGSSWWSERTAGNSFAYETWCDCPERYENDRSAPIQGSSGWRLWARASDLQLFLSEQGMDLICEVQVERRTHSAYLGPYAREEEKHKTFDRILLCRCDGTIETASRRVGSWTPYRRRVAA
jgi:hypothetical protein